MKALTSLINANRLAALRAATRRTEALHALGRVVEPSQGDPFTARCGFCGGTGTTAEFSRDSGATIRSQCDACGGLGSKEGAMNTGATT